ncbi:glycosyltransferase [Priestia megaterium]|uniref:glycosyltransferase n=1 Tax=Priestia megaterium TaxID=1404 RepID=UPI002E1EB84B|nr:glycosyltransferase [Priestia megaterium]MED4263428.1 glycosyltransferase [Priestia megaterium]MED4276692.1 glycosyltransferase [Priestia megaterium]MED4316461.1 glycosyltransferase [Priestia megaterium]
MNYVKQDSIINILFIQPYASHVGGVDTVLLQLVEGLDKDIFKPIVLLPSRSPYVEKYEEVGAKVIFETISVFGKPTSLLYYPKNFYKLFISISKIKKIIKEYNIHLIHSHKMELMGGNIAGRLTGIPTVQTIHELPRKPLVAYKAVGYLNHLFNNNVIVLCERSKVVLKWGKYESKKVRKIYNGIRLQDTNIITSSLKEEIKLSSEDRIVITVARLSPMKGIEYLLEAASQVRKNNSNIKFVIVGDVAFENEKQYKEKLFRKAKDLNLENTVFFLGLRRDVTNLLNQSDLFILPSVYDIFPTVILEAMNSQLPVIATDVGGVPEMVRDDTGIIVPATNSDALANAIQDIFVKDYKKLGVNGRQLLEREFTQEKYVSQTVKLYDELLTNRG